MGLKGWAACILGEKGEGQPWGGKEPYNLGIAEEVPGRAMGLLDWTVKEKSWRKERWVLYLSM